LKGTQNYFLAKILENYKIVQRREKECGKIKRNILVLRENTSIVETFNCVKTWIWEFEVEFEVFAIKYSNHATHG